MKLLERSTELDRLTALLRTASGGEGRLIFVGGEAGVGKTSLVREFCRSVQSPVRVLTGACDPLSAPRPLGPLLDIASTVGGELDRLLQTNGPRHEVFRAFLRMLLAGQKPSVVVFEDVHWADDATLDLLRYLGRRIDTAPTLLIVTYRDDELGPRHPLRLVVGDLATAAGVYRIAVSPLSIDAVRMLAEGTGLDPAALHSRTGGNPFFLTEVLAYGGQGTPPTVRDAVLARAARLSAVARETLEVAAVIGFRSESWLLAELRGTGIEDCVAAGMLRVEPNALSQADSATSRALPTMPKARVTAKRSWRMPQPRPSGPQRCEPIEKLRLNTPAPCVLPGISRQSAEPTCWNAGRPNAP